ncbi:GbsR/MarR family transcriptional regulator [Saccharopolyspora spinosa]|nr:MarR family transcriptional regulator [Saccharopolyspora spinosa]
MHEGDAGADQAEDFIESFAGLYSSQLPKMAARMLAALLVTEDTELSSRDLIETLGASAATVSNSGRLLLRLGMVERTVSPETRRDLYRIRDDVWVRMYREAGKTVGSTIKLLNEALDERRWRHSRATERMREMRDFYTFLDRDIPEMVTRYEKWRAEQAGCQRTRNEKSG